MAVAHGNSRSRWIARVALCTFGCAMLSSGVRAQDTSSTTTQKGPSSYETKMRSGTVVYV